MQKGEIYILCAHILKLITDNQSILVDARCNYFAIRTTKPWNYLPAATITFHSLTTFKRKLNSIGMSSFLYVK